jgi:hypothetical protein
MIFLITIGYNDYYLYDNYVYLVKDFNPIPVMPYPQWLRRMEQIERAAEAAIK